MTRDLHECILLSPTTDLHQHIFQSVITDLHKHLAVNDNRSTQTHSAVSDKRSTQTHLAISENSCTQICLQSVATDLHKVSNTVDLHRQILQSVTLQIYTNTSCRQRLNRSTQRHLAVTWCFMPSQPVRLYQGNTPCSHWHRSTQTHLAASDLTDLQKHIFQSLT